MKDWSKIVEKYRGKWIALADGEETVVASGKDVKSAIALSKEKGHSDPILFRVPDEIADFVGYENSL
ncbi:hypothetical protein HY417_01455 [Candidatus Kaiserbacteria bacterium]|nr:hypothetical protein [Candidatus Kaiserbacteria bacterium]